MVAEDGFEPPTLKVWTSCSSQLSYSAILVDLKIFELSTPWMQIRCSFNWAIYPVRNCLIMIVKIKCCFNILFIKCPTWVYKHLIFINRNINMWNTFIIEKHRPIEWAVLDFKEYYLYFDDIQYISVKYKTPSTKA